MYTTRAQIGRRGETLALQYLQSIGYHIDSTNLRIRYDEIDIVAYDPIDQAMVFVEVKSRSRNRRNYAPELGLDRRKKNAMKRAARRWVMQHDYRGGYRMDLICIAANRVVDHLKELSWS